MCCTVPGNSRSGLGGACPPVLPVQALFLGFSTGTVAKTTPVPVPCCSPSSRKQNQGALKGSFKINKKLGIVLI